MQYQLDIEVDLPRDRVIELIDNPDNLAKWQEGFISIEHLTGEVGEKGSTYKLEYQMGKRHIEMVETILERRLPEEFSATYEAKGVWNKVENFFVEEGAKKTLWKTNHEFKCTGIMRVFAFLFPGMFKKQSFKYMEDFKTWAEAGGK